MPRRRGAARLLPRCGTSLTFESTRWPDDIHLMVGNFDNPADFTPQCHVFAGERLPWLHIADDLPQYRTVPSEGDPMPRAGMAADHQGVQRSTPQLTNGTPVRWKKNVPWPTTAMLRSGRATSQAPETGKPRGEDVLRLDGVAERVLLGAIVPPGIVEMVEGEDGNSCASAAAGRPISQLLSSRSRCSASTRIAPPRGRRGRASSRWRG